MTRLYSDYAYSDAPIERCFWAEAVPDSLLQRPAPGGDISADVAIIGAGYTGLSCALKLAQSGVSTVLLDSRFPGWGASGRNGGFCCLGGSKLDDKHLDRMFGKAARLDWRATERHAVEFVADLIRDHGIEADQHSQGETVLAHKPSRARFESAGLACQENYGVEPEILTEQEACAAGMHGPFYGAMTTQVGFGLHPRKYVLGLLHAAEFAGARVFGDSPVHKIAPGPSGFVLHVPAGKVTCKKVLLATNGYSSDALPGWMSGRYLPVQSSILTTRPLSRVELDAAGWTSGQMAYDTRTLLHYFRLMPDNRFLFGMRGGLRSTARSDKRIERLARRDFEAMFPAWRHVETPYFWSGMVCLAPRLVPFAGPVPRMPGMFAGFAYHGNGVAMGSYTGAHMADVILGREARQPMPAFVSAGSRRFPLGRFRKAMMWPAYAFARLADI